MKPFPLRAPLLALTVLLLAGCASPEPRYHTLAPQRIALPPLPAQPRWIEVQPPAVPAGLDRVQLVLRREDGGVRRLENERWSAALPDELRDALALQLQARLGAVDLYRRGAAGEAPLYRISAEVLRLEAGSAGAEVAVSWTVRRLPDGAARSGLSRYRRDAPAATADAAVAAYREGLAQTEEEIAAAVEDLR